MTFRVKYIDYIPQKPKRYLILIVILSFLLSSCSYFRHFYEPLDPEEQLVADITPILDEIQLSEISKLETVPEIETYIDQFWADMDPDPETDINEARIEYESRLAYVHSHYPYKRGWKHSDRGRIYLIYGPPDNIDFVPWQLSLYLKGAEMKAVEVWTYNIFIGELHNPTIFDDCDPGLMKFCFTDLLGSGRYTQVFSNVPGELIDPRVYLDETSYQFNRWRIP